MQASTISVPIARERCPRKKGGAARKFLAPRNAPNWLSPIRLESQKELTFLRLLLPSSRLPNSLKGKKHHRDSERNTAVVRVQIQIFNFHKRHTLIVSVYWLCKFMPIDWCEKLWQVNEVLYTKITRLSVLANINQNSKRRLLYSFVKVDTVKRNIISILTYYICTSTD